MAGKQVKQWLLLLLLSAHLLTTFATTTKKTYIVYVDKSAKPQEFTDHSEWYSSMVKSVTSHTTTRTADHDEHDDQQDRIIYTYQTAFHGLAARLTEAEAQNLQNHEAVLATFPETVYRLHTTRSPLFLGLEPEQHAVAGPPAHDVVVGVLDTGIWPESPSFNDTGMDPVPAHWRGACETGRSFDRRHCNRKIVGARSFYRGYEAASGKIDEEEEFKSARDQDGHGTHTAATVAGSPVHGASLLGYAGGTARGMAPGARLAAYKVCWAGGCFSSDILSAIDRAVADGVHVLSISLGGGVSSYYRDSLSVGTFAAMEKGVFVSCSAGNGGPDPISLTNVSPWVATVGASTMDREFPANVKLGSGKSLTGASLYKGQRNLSVNRLYPLVYNGDSNSTSPTPSSMCLEGTLNPRSVAGKIVICDRGISPRVQKGQVVKDAGGVGMILTNTAANGEELVADCHLLPAAAIGESAGKLIKRYALSGKNNKNATATLEFLGTKIRVRPSPIVAAFSSRGPNILSPEILKPDMVAPGVNILAAWTGEAGPSGLPTDHRRTRFNILSGTSMSCPHVSGVAALIKSRRPEWGPAAIKSALMTTAYVHDNMRRPLKDAASTAAPSTPFDHGAGHINPMRALDPGLIYDITPRDYFEFLCTQGLTGSELAVFSRSSNMTCRGSFSSAGDLNYPAISVVFPENANGSTVVTVRRTVTNVGPAGSSYRAVVSPFRGAYVKVEPERLEFTGERKRMTYSVTFRVRSRQTVPEFGAVVWKDGVHKVRSPVVIMWLPPL
ncbi:subtilase 1.3 [Striga hermonthica]|uniref:Subtilase 1.3 n=1 Tax=Striga hermonthica TaxID=68872 RepID=A0A9N7NK31_STRHE|nr:subtilase 1.3 [Striga hermonthica]